MRLCRAIKDAEQLECIDILLNTISAGEREIGGSGVLLINVTCRKFSVLSDPRQTSTLPTSLVALTASAAQPLD